MILSGRKNIHSDPRILADLRYTCFGVIVTANGCCLMQVMPRVGGEQPGINATSDAVRTHHITATDGKSRHGHENFFLSSSLSSHLCFILIDINLLV